MSAREIERLYEVQHDLLVKLKNEAMERCEAEAMADYKSRCLALLKEQRLWWPVRLVQIGRPAIVRRRRKWFSRHGVERWYGVMQYVRIGPFLFLLGDRPDLMAEEAPHRDSLYRRRSLAPARGEQVAARALQAVNRRHEHAE